MNRKVDWSLAPEFELTESGQVAKHKIALANVDKKGKVYGVSPFFKCREYYGDALYHIHTGAAVKQYGFVTEECSWDGKYLLTSYQGVNNYKIAARWEKMNEMLLGTSPAIPYEKVSWPDKDLQVYLVEVPDWYHATLVRSSVLTSLLRTLWYPDMRNLPENSGYAERCVSDSMFKTFFPTPSDTDGKNPKHVNMTKTIWETIVFPALNQDYGNVVCVSDRVFDTFENEVREGRHFYVHGSTGIYSAWTTLMSYQNVKGRFKTFKPESSNTDAHWQAKKGNKWVTNGLFIEQLINNCKEARKQYAA